MVMPIGAYKLTLDTGAKDMADNAIVKVSTASVAIMTVTSKIIAAKSTQMV